jgi:CelD/BcsL family acetyltransferase involved in cellulose biosynthesis
VVPDLVVRPELGSWAAQWDHLVDLSPLPSPFLRSWWLAGTAGPRRQFLLVLQDDRLLGGLALEKKRWRGLPSLSLMGAGPLCPDHLDLLADRDQGDTVARKVSDWLRRPGAFLVDLEGIDAGSLLIRALPLPAHQRPLAVAPWTSLTADPDAYLAARPQGFRKNLRRATSRLSAEGADHRINRGQSALRSLETLRQLHAAQWGSRSQFLPSFSRFAAGCRLGAEVDEVAVHELAVGESVIATVAVFEVAGRISLYQSARLTDFRWRDAMTVLLNAIIRDGCTRGFSEVDFLRGNEGYKSNFATEQRHLLRVISGRPARAVLGAESIARKVKRQMSRGQ